MNDHYYNLISEFIPPEERSILNKNIRYFMGYKKRKKYLPFYMNLCLHSGSTCFRYCVCRVLNEEDLINSIVAYLPHRNRNEWGHGVTLLPFDKLSLAHNGCKFV